VGLTQLGLVNRASITGNAFAVVAGRAVATAAGIVIYVALGQGLGAAGTGLYSLAIAVYGVALVFSRLGLDIGATGLVASKFARGDADDAAKTAGAVLVGGLALGLAVGAVLFFAAPQFARLFGVPALATQLRIVAFGLPLGSAAIVAMGALQGAAHVGFGVWTGEVLQGGLTAAAIVAIAWVPGLRSAPPAMAITLPACLVGIFVVRRTVVVFRLGPGVWRRIGGPAFAEALRFSRPLAMNTALGTAFAMSSTLIVGYFLDVADVGRYASAARAVRLMPFGLAAATTVFMPVAAALYANHDRRRLEVAYRATARWAWHFGAPLAALLLVRPGLVLGLFGHEFVGAENVIRILAVGQLVNLATGSCGPMLLMTTHQSLELRNTLTSAVLSVVLGMLFTRPLGVVGAALATASTVALVSAMRVTQVRRLVGVVPVSVGLGRAAVAAAVAAIVLAALPIPVKWSLVLRLVEQGAVALVAYAGTVFLLHPDPEDLQLLGALRTRLARVSLVSDAS
jgi:O-antigen/teichoic acid export membrane protein